MSKPLILMMAGAAWLGATSLAAAQDGPPGRCGDPGSEKNCGFAGGHWMKQNSGADYSISSEGRGALRFELRGGDRWSQDRNTNHASERTEISEPGAVRAANQDAHVSFNMTVDPGPRTTSAWTVVGQFHQALQPGEAGSPPVEQLLLPGDLFTICLRTSAQHPLTVNPHEFCPFKDPAFQRGRTYHFEYSLRFSTGPDGYARVVRDGATIIDYHGPLGYVEPTGPYLKLGIYRAPAPETLVVHYDHVMVDGGGERRRWDQH